MVSFKSRFQYGISSFDYESRGFRPQGWATGKKGEKKEKKRLFKSMLLDGSKGVWNNKDKTRDPPEASRKTKLRLSNRLSKYRDEISIDGLSGIDASGVDRKKESRQTRRRRKNFFLTRIKIFDELYSRNR